MRTYSITGPLIPGVKQLPQRQVFVVPEACRLFVQSRFTGKEN